MYFIYLQLTIRWLIKHFTVIYGDANKQFLTLNFNIFCCEKISLSGIPISLPKIADLYLSPRKDHMYVVQSSNIAHLWFLMVVHDSFKRITR